MAMTLLLYFIGGRLLRVCSGVLEAKKTAKKRGSFTWTHVVIHIGLLPERRQAYPRQLVNIKPYQATHLEGLEERHCGIALEVAVLVVEALPHAGRRYPFALRQWPRLEHGRIEHGKKRFLQASLQSDAFGCLQRATRRNMRVVRSSFPVLEKQSPHSKCAQPAVGRQCESKSCMHPLETLNGGNIVHTWPWPYGIDMLFRVHPPW